MSFNFTTLLARAGLACCLPPTPASLGTLGLEAYDFVGKRRNTSNFASSSGIVQDVRREELKMPMCIYSE